jgi:hypothetical protein
MIDWLYILILVLAIGLVVIQEMLIRKKDRVISEYEKIMIRVEPILAMVVAAQEAARQNQPKSDQPKVH